MQEASGLESNCILSLEELEEAQTRRQRQVKKDISLHSNQ